MALVVPLAVGRRLVTRVRAASDGDTLGAALGAGLADSHAFLAPDAASALQPDCAITNTDALSPADAPAAHADA